jgi:hypothetical protein
MLFSSVRVPAVASLVEVAPGSGSSSSWSSSPSPLHGEARPRTWRSLTMPDQQLRRPWGAAHAVERRWSWPRIGSAGWDELAGRGNRPRRPSV